MSRDKEFHGLCFSVSNWPVEKYAYLPQLQEIAKHTDWVRIYNAYMPDFGSEAHRLGLKVAAGAVLLEQEPEKNLAEVERLICDALDGNVDLAVIGNESIYATGVSVEDHIRYIERFRKACPHIPVATAQDADRIVEYPEILSVCDFIAMHAYPYWGGTHIDDALDHLLDRYERVVKLAHGREVQIFETGWPSYGETKGKAVASLDNALRYMHEVVEWGSRCGVKIFYFEALDEPWKADIEREQGAHWGVFTKHGVRKLRSLQYA